MADNDKTIVRLKGNPSVKVTDDQTIVKDIKVGQPIKRIKQARFHASTLGGDSAGSALLRDSNGQVVITTNLIPSENGQFNLGSPSNKFKGLYIGANTLYIGNLAISEDSNGNAVISSIDSSGFIIGGTTKAIATDLDSSVIVNIIQPLIDSSFNLLLGDSTPETLDTLKEIATALNDDPNFFTNITTTINSSSIGLKWTKDGDTARATEWKDSDQEVYTIRSTAITNDLLTLTLASFSPSISASGQSRYWDQPATQFSVTVDNPSDFPSRYIAGVRSITQTAGNLSTVLSDYLTDGPSSTPAGGVDWNQTFTAHNGSYIRSTSTTITGGSAGATVTFYEDDSSSYGTTASFTTTWQTPNVSINMSNLSGNIFLEPYQETPYTVSVTGISNSSNYTHTITATGGSVNSQLGSGEFTFDDELHQDNQGGRTLSISTQMRRPEDVTGTEYTVTDTASDTNLSSTWTYPSLSIFTASTGTSPTNSDLVSHTTFGGSVTTYGNQSKTLSQFITNSESTPQAFWFGVRSSASQPSTFQTGASAALLSDVTPTEVTVNLSNTYTDEDYDFYGITLQPGNTYVSIS
jgi:hypothetical protein